MLLYVLPLIRVFNRYLRLLGVFSYDSLDVTSESDIISVSKGLRVQQGCKNISAKISILDVHKSKMD